MDKRTIRIPDDVAAEIDRRASEEDVSDSEAARQLLRRGLAADELETENQRLQRRVRALIEQREAHDELVEYVEGEKAMQQRERERRDAPAWKRAKWWLFGRD